MAGDNLGTLTVDLIANTGGFEAGMDRAQRALKSTAKEAAYQGGQLEKLLGQIDPVTGAYARLDAQEEKLRTHRKNGTLPLEEFDIYLKKLNAQRDALSKTDDLVRKTGVTAGQTNAAFRQLPAQISDIFTSLAGGQNPLMVLIQQGGQIKDSFGGIGATFTAFGEKFRSIFTGVGPDVLTGVAAGLGAVGTGATAAGEGAKNASEGLGAMAEGANTAADASKNAAEAAGALRTATASTTVGVGLIVGAFVAAAAAAAALAVAYKQGSDESTAYRKSLAMTGNTAGTTAEQLSVIAEAVSKANGTVNEAAASLAQLAGSTRIPLAEFEKIATAAANFEDVTDKATKETVANFEKIAKDPLKAIVSLNESMNFLTASTYEQIAALVKQGKDTEAASLANTAYADALNTVESRVKANLGTIEKAWKSVKDGAKGAWDAMLNVGREDSFAESLAEIDERVKSLKDENESLAKLPFGMGNPRTTYNNAKVEREEAQRTQILIAKAEADRRAAAKGDAQQAQLKAVEAEVEVARIRKDSETNAEKREQAIAKYRRAIDDIRAKNPNSALLDEKQIAKDIADINEKYADKKEKAVKAYVENAGAKELDQAKQVYAVLQSQAALVGSQVGEQQKLGAAAQELIKWEQQIADIKTKGTLTAAQKSLLANEEQITAQKRLNAELEKDTALRTKSVEEAAKLVTFQEQVADALAQAQQGLSNQVAGVGLGAEGRKRLQDDLAIRQDYQKQMQRLQRDLQNNKISQDLYDQETTILRNALNERLASQQEYYRQLEQAQATWANGASAALNDYVTQAQDVAGMAQSAFASAFDGMEDALVAFATTGKLSFKALADSIIADIARIVIRTQLIGPLLGAVFGGGGGGLAGAAASLFGGTESSGGSNALGTAKSIFDGASTAFSVGTSSFGQAVSAGWAAGEGFLGGVQGAFDAGAASVGSGITGLFSGAGAAASGGAGVMLDAGGNVVNYSAQGAGAAAYTPFLSAISGALMGYQNSGVKGAVAGAAGGFAGAKGGAALGSYFGPIGTAVGAVIGGMLGAIGGSKLFGGDWITKDEGFQLGVAGGDLESYGFEYQKKKGGLFSSNKKRTRLTTMDPAVQAALDNTYAATLGTVIGLFDSLDVTLNDAVLDGLNVSATQISTRDKTAEQIQEEIKAWFIGLGDAAVAEVNRATASGLEGFNLEGLTAFVNNLYSVNASLKMIGVGMVGFNVAGGRAVENLIALAGSVELLNGNITKFYDGFTSDLQKSIDTLNGVREQFASINVVMPATRESFAQIVKGLDVSTEAGRQMFTILTANAEQAAGAYTILEQRQSTYYAAFLSDSENTARTVTELTAQIKSLGVELPGTRSAFRAMVEAAATDTSAEGKKLYESLMNVSGLAGQAFDALEQQATEAAAAAADQLQKIRDALMLSVTNSQSALQRAVNAEQKAATDAYNARVTSLNDMSATAAKSVSELTTVSNSLSAALKALRGDSDSAVQMLRTQAQATLQNALATVRAGGSLAGVEGLSDALDVISGNNTDLYTSLEQFNADQDRTANVVSELNLLNGKQLSNAEQTVAMLKDQLKLAEDDYKAQQARYAEQLEFAQAQLDALNGVDTSIISVVAAVKAMNFAVVAALQAQSDSAGKTNTSTNNATLVQSAYQAVLGRSADAAGAEYWQKQLANGSITLDQLATAIANAAREKGQLVLPGYATGGRTSGLSWVGENGPEIIATGGAQVYSAAQSEAIMSGSGSSTVGELQALREYMEAALYQIALNSAETAKNTKPLPLWNQNGLPSTDPESLFA